MASQGYWRNWERQTAWLMREIVFSMIQGNPNIEKSSKPVNSKEIFKISDDDKVKKSADHKRVSPEELEEVKRRLMEFKDKKHGTME